jgi:hypothetical protein
MADEGTEWVTLRVASQRLGRSPETIRRQIKDGTFEYPAEREQRAPGDTRDRYKVRLPKAPDTPQATPHEALRPLVDALDQEREERRRLAAENADLRERAGRAEASAEASARHITALAAQIADMAAQRDEWREKAERAWRRWWWPW